LKYLILLTFLAIWYIMIQASKGHAFHACMKKNDFGTRKTPKSSHFSQKNERI